MATTRSLARSDGRLERARGLRWRRSAATVLVTTCVAIVALVYASPFYWMTISAFRPLAETIAFPIRLVPSTVTLDNIDRLLSTSNFGRTLLNSAIVAVATAALATFICAAAGYAFALLRFRGRQMLFRVVIATLLVPVTVLLVPTFLIMVKLGLVDTWWALILPAAAPAIGIFWMRQYIGAAIPRDLIDAARVDGAGELRIFGQVVLPLIRPGMAALAIFVAVGSWNEFVLPFIYIQSQDQLTFPPRLVQFFPNAGQFQTPYDLIMAGAVLATLPLLLLFLGFQRYFVPAITVGSGR